MKFSQKHAAYHFLTLHIFQGRYYITDTPPRWETDIDSEIEGRERELTWISEVGSELTARNHAKTIQEAPARAQKRMSDLKRYREDRHARINSNKVSCRKLTADLSGIKEWMREMETRLSQNIYVPNTTEKEYKKKVKEYQVGVRSYLFRNLWKI